MRLPKYWNWKWVVAACAVLAAGVYSQRAAWKDIWSIALRDEESSQIFLVPVVAAYLVWMRAGRLRQSQPGPSWLGPIFVTAGLLIGLYGQNYAYQALEHVAAVMVAVGCVVSVLGRGVLLNFLPAFLVLIFLVPVPPTFRENLSVPLEGITAKMTQDVFEVLGVAVQRSGNLLSINGVNVTIAEACNGLRMGFSLLLVSYMYAFGAPLRWYVRMSLLAACPVIAVVFNVARLVPTVWFYGNLSQSLAERLHDLSGWVMLVVAFLSLMAIVRTLRWAFLPVTKFTLARE